jgi:hypothetical protein
MSNNAILAALRRMGYDKDEMTGHGFRAMARTILDEVLHVRPEYIEHQLAHAVRDPNGRAYNRTAHLDERKKMMQLWSDYLDEIKAGAKILPRTLAVDLLDAFDAYVESPLTTTGRWSRERTRCAAVFVPRDEQVPHAAAGDMGLELLVLQFADGS